MQDQLPPGPPEEQIPAPPEGGDETLPEGQAPPPAPPPEMPMGPPPGPPVPQASPAQMQAMQAKQQLDAAKAELVRRQQTIDLAERADQGKLQVLLDQIRTGQLSMQQAEPILERFNSDRQGRIHDAGLIEHAAREINDIETRVGYELMEQHRRGVLEPVAHKMAIQGLVDEAATWSGDPENFPKTKLRRTLERTLPDSWRGVQQSAVEDYRDSRLTTRAASGVDEMGGTGTSSGRADEADALANLTAGLQQMYPRAPRR